MATKLVIPELDIVYICMYRVGMLVFAKGSEHIIMKTSNIISVEKLDNYEYNIRSIIKLQLKVDIRQKLWIINNRANIICKFELDKFGMDTDLDNQVGGDQVVWNAEFSVFLNDDDANMDAEALASNIAANTGSEFNMSDLEDQDYYQAQEIFEVYLYNTELLNASKVNVNKVYSTGVLQTYIGQLLTQSGHKRVLMSPIENSKVYKELLVPSYPAYQALVYIDQYYGLYKLGASIFYDVDILYIINPNGKATASRQDEWTETCFLVTSKSDSNPGNGMVAKPMEEKFYVNVPDENVSPKKPSEAKAMQYGGTIKVVTTDDVTVKTHKTSTSSNNKNVYQGYAQSTDSAFGATTIKARMEENEAVIYITGDGFDMSAFTMNKEYTIVFEDITKQAKYGGARYRLAYADHFLVIQSDLYMKSSHQIVLKKCSAP